MKLQLKSLVTILVVWLLISSFSAYSQTFVIDTTEFLNPIENSLSPESYKYDIDEPEIISNDLVTKDMTFVPANILYKNRWDTLNIRIGRTDWTKISDTSILFLHNLHESNFVFPYKGKVISKYGPRGGRFHAGMDIKLNHGDTVRSAFDGKIRIARAISGYGKLIVVRHNNGLETVYGHLSAYLVDVNQEVKAGQPIGLGGRTGRASTDHLHFETRILGEHFNPSKIIDFDNYALVGNHLALDKNLLGFGTKGSTMVVDTARNTDSKYIHIKSGDTLYALALRHKTSVDNICKLNGISPKKVLKVGSKLRIE